MLKIINDLSLFFEDCYREISVREYAREMETTPPTASKILKEFKDEGLLKMKSERRFIFFRANRESLVLKDLSRVYWRNKLATLTEHLKNVFHPDSIVLFGSLTQLEVNNKSDIDIALFGGFKKETNLKRFEKDVGRKIQVFFFESLDKVNKHLKTNIQRGMTLAGTLK